MRRDVLEDSPFPWWEWSIEHNIVTASPKKVLMLGYDPQEFKGKGFEAYTDLLHPEDYQRSMQAMRSLLSGSADIYQVDYRILATDGTYHWYMDRGTISTKGPSGNPLKIRGLVFDLGSLFSSERQLEVLTHEVRDSLFLTQGPASYISVCSNCRRLKKGDQFIPSQESFLRFMADRITHTVCPDCIRSLYPEFADSILNAS